MKLNSWNCVTRFGAVPLPCFFAQNLVCECEHSTRTFIWKQLVVDPTMIQVYPSIARWSWDISSFSLILPQWFPVLNGGCSWPGARLVRVRMLRNRPGYLWRWSGIPALRIRWGACEIRRLHFHHSIGRWFHLAFVQMHCTHCFCLGHLGSWRLRCNLAAALWRPSLPARLSKVRSPVTFVAGLIPHHVGVASLILYT